MARVGRSNPPVNLNGREGAVSDSGKLNRTGRSCSAEIVWLGIVSEDNRFWETVKTYYARMP